MLDPQPATTLTAPAGPADEPLLATCWSSAGDAASDRTDKRSPLPLRERIEAAAAQTLGARQIKITPDGQNSPFDPARWAARFAELAEQAEGVGARLGLEFFGWANIGTLAQGLALVEDAGHPNGGVVIDVWHVARAGTGLDELATVPMDRIVGVELSDADATVVGTLFEETVHRRRFCGEGSFDLTGMIAALRSAGWRGPWGVEILSDSYVALPAREALDRAATTARAVLAQA